MEQWQKTAHDSIILIEVIFHQSLILDQLQLEHCQHGLKKVLVKADEIVDSLGQFLLIIKAHRHSIADWHLTTVVIFDDEIESIMLELQAEQEAKLLHDLLCEVGNYGQ